MMSFSFLIEMGWKSAMIAGIALLLVRLLRGRAAADRNAVLRAGVVLLIALPAISLLLPALQVETLPPVAQSAPPLLSPQALAALSAETPGPSAIPATDEAVVDFAAAIGDNADLLLACAYLAGLLLVGFHLFAGLSTLKRWTHQAEDIVDPAWTDALDRASAGTGIAPRLLVSDEAETPLSWGWRDPVILIDRETLTRSGDAEAVVAHEVAHIVRHDWPALMISRAAVALFWFNPLVWLLEREVGQHAEEAADCDALGQVEPTRYAQTLVTCAQVAGGCRVPAHGISPNESGLAKRVKAILDERLRTTPSGSVWAIAAIVLSVACAGPLAALKLVPSASAEEMRPAPVAPNAPVAPVAPRAPRALHAALAPMAPLQTLQASEAPEAPAAPATPEVPYAHEMPEVTRLIASAHAAAVKAQLSDEEIARIERDAEKAAAEASRVAERAVRDADKYAAHAAHAAAIATRAGADAMVSGADAMEKGAKDMREEARKLRGADYRAAKIAEAARRGETVTHQELIDAIPELESGASGMVEGAREMRRQAEDMRRGRG